MMEGTQNPYSKKGNKSLVVASVLLLVSCVFFSWQITVYLDATQDGIEPDVEEHGEVGEVGIDDQIISAKTTLESISIELDNLVSLL